MSINAAFIKTIAFGENIARISLCAGLFGLFGGICSVGNLLFLPIIALRLEKIKAVRIFCRALVAYSWGFFIWCGKVCGYFRYEFNGFESMQKHIVKGGVLLVANHPSLLDVVFLLSRIKGLNCVVKGKLANNIFLYPAIKASGYILNDDNEVLLAKSLECLKEGENLLIFPEGTRTGDKIIFHKVACYIAINAAREIGLICIDMSPKGFLKGCKWYEIPKMSYIFALRDFIITADFKPLKQNSLRVRALHSYLNQFYQKEIK